MALRRRKHRRRPRPALLNQLRKRRPRSVRPDKRMRRPDLRQPEGHSAA